MIVSQEVPLASVLRGSAAKVLLHLLLHRGESETDSAIMQGSGIHDRNTYYVAKKQLKELGLWENPDRIIHTGVGESLPVGGITHTPVGGITHTLPVPRVTATVEATVLHHDPQPLGDASWLDHTIQADRMEDTGDWNSSRSPCRLRRAAQVRALQGAFKEMFAQELTESSAIDLLRFGGGSAEAVYEALQTSKERKAQYPVGYTKSILKAQAQPTSQVRSAQIEKPAAEEGSIMMSDFSPEYKRKLEKMRAAGLLDEEDD